MADTIIAGTVIIEDSMNALVIQVVKAIPMLSTMPALLKNDLMDEAIPRRSGATDDIMALVFGGWNSPEPKLLMNIHNDKSDRAYDPGAIFIRERSNDKCCCHDHTENTHGFSQLTASEGISYYYRTVSHKH